MPPAPEIASLHVIGASVTPCKEGKRLLVRTEKGPASLLFSPDLALSIGKTLIFDPQPPKRPLVKPPLQGSGRTVSPERAAAYERIHARVLQGLSWSDAALVEKINPRSAYKFIRGREKRLPITKPGGQLL